MDKILDETGDNVALEAVRNKNIISKFILLNNINITLSKL